MSCVSRKADNYKKVPDDSVVWEIRSSTATRVGFTTAIVTLRAVFVTADVVDETIDRKCLSSHGDD